MSILNYLARQTRSWRITALAVLVFSLSACGAGDNDGGLQKDTLSLDMEIPDSLSGGKQDQAKIGSLSIQRAANGDGIGQPCGFNGSDEDDPFRNGYEMTKFMVSAISTWTCVADLLIDASDFVPHNGEIVETENDTLADDYDPNDPTHYRVVDDSDTQTSVYMYYGYARANPPTEDDLTQFYISWDKSEDDVYQGKMIIDAEHINGTDRDAEDPTVMRMDFDFNSDVKSADMFLKFDENNEWANGLRIQLDRDLNAFPGGQVFTARGLMDMKRQFIPNEDVNDIPVFKVYTVSNRVGDGAAIAEFEDVAIGFLLNEKSENHLGNYVFDKTDIYFFDADQNSEKPWDWINKSFSYAQYRGARTTPETDGTWIPFDPSLQDIIKELGLDADYFQGDKCGTIDSNCVELFNAAFEDGFNDQEPNQGADPMDWRSTAISEPDYLESVYLNGVDWGNTFDLEFTPE